MSETISTAITKLFGIKYPIILAGMNKAAGPVLAAAVCNAGGLGVIGGVGFSPRILKIQIKLLKKNLINKNAPFGVDLLIPKVGTGARPTNTDYTKGKLDELIDIIIGSGAKLFVCAVGVAPPRIVKKVHDAGILYMNMIGAPKHITYAAKAGADIMCIQGGEGGGHTGSIATSCLLPECVDMCRNLKSPLTGGPIYCVGAGGVFDGRGLAMALNYGAEAVWVGTRFVCSTESGASMAHKKDIMNANHNSTIRTEIYTGRPLRVIKEPYAIDWETNRKEEMKQCLKDGVIPYYKDYMKNKQNPPPYNTHLSGQCAGNVNNIKPAKQIIEDMMNECIDVLRYNTARIQRIQSKL